MKNRSRRPASPNLYAEQVTPPWWSWVLVGMCCLSIGVMVSVAAGSLTGWLAAGISAGIGGWLLARTTVRIAVTAAELMVGRTRLPVRIVASAVALNPVDTRRVLGVDADARAFLVLRAWIPTAVQVVLADCDDVTPYWLITTRRPELLAATLTAVIQ
jgi:hypothetical protein